MVENKKRIPWNKGLTKDTDDRIKKYSITLANHPSLKKGRKVTWGLKIGNALRGRKMPWVKKNSPFKKGNQHILWKGGKRIHQGYVLTYTPNHPNNTRNYVKEHRLVMEKSLGRYLKNHEIVHHINRIKTDNRIENLMLVVRENHYGKIQCPYCQQKFLIK